MGEVSSMVTLPNLEIDGVPFPAKVVPPSSSKALFLGGAGVRGLDIGGRFIKFTAIGVYLDETAVKSLAGKWSGKTADELAESLEFYNDVISGPFEKFSRVTMILPLTGEQYSEKVSENCVAIWKAIGIYTDAEAEAISKFKEVFKPETFAPGSSICFTHSPTGALTIAFSKDNSVPETHKIVIENKPLCRAILESIIGQHGVSPAAKRSLAVRFCELLKESQSTSEETEVEKPAAAIVA
ncbi:hypothetical protein LUZ60_011395 [Juncus effusus]|nr:hypothetical protein LUZ60_011395 [Juncus effusus]